MRNRWLQDYIGTSSEQSVRRLWNGHSLFTWSHSGNASSEGRCRRPGPSCGAIMRVHTHWLDYDVAALAFLIVGIAAVGLLAIII
jgi:hypothetical protein